MKGLSNFRSSAMSRTEMKNVVGGGCHVVFWTANGDRLQSPETYPNLDAAKAAAYEAAAVADDMEEGERYGWCCASCV